MQMCYAGVIRVNPVICVIYCNCFDSKYEVIKFSVLKAEDNLVFYWLDVFLTTCKGGCGVQVAVANNELCAD
jgi:hypothetical protein